MNLQALTPARILQGRSGTRYKTSHYLTLRAEHSVAKDAVESELSSTFLSSLPCIHLTTQAADKNAFLLYPQKGRQLHENSRQKLLAEATFDVDVQIILSDGLSPWAIEKQGAELLLFLQRELHAEGFRCGKPILVTRGRIGVQDEIGVLTRSKATLIALGERPGLGTGDSLSIYTAYGPKIGQDNAEKNCISNIRPQGLGIHESAELCRKLLRQTFHAEGGGTKLMVL